MSPIVSHPTRVTERFRTVWPVAPQRRRVRVTVRASFPRHSREKRRRRRDLHDLCIRPQFQRQYLSRISIHDRRLKRRSLAIALLLGKNPSVGCLSPRTINRARASRFAPPKLTERRIEYKLTPSNSHLFAPPETRKTPRASSVTRSTPARVETRDTRVCGIICPPAARAVLRIARSLRSKTLRKRLNRADARARRLRRANDVEDEPASRTGGASPRAQLPGFFLLSSPSRRRSRVNGARIDGEHFLRSSYLFSRAPPPVEAFPQARIPILNRPLHTAMGEYISLDARPPTDARARTTAPYNSPFTKTERTPPHARTAPHHRAHRARASASLSRAPARQRGRRAKSRNDESRRASRDSTVRIRASTHFFTRNAMGGARTSRVDAPFASRVDVHVWANSTHSRDELPRASLGRPMDARRSTDRCSTSHATWSTVVVMIFRLRARGRSPPLVQYVDVMDDTNEHMPSVASV